MKFWNILLKIIASIICLPLIIVGVVLLLPIIFLCMLIDLISAIMADIWVG